jgi:hypothetical protein
MIGNQCFFRSSFIFLCLRAWAGYANLTVGKLDVRRKTRRCHERFTIDVFNKDSYDQLNPDRETSTQKRVPPGSHMLDSRLSTASMRRCRGNGCETQSLTPPSETGKGFEISIEWSVFVDNDMFYPPLTKCCFSCRKNKVSFIF